MIRGGMEFALTSNIFLTWYNEIYLPVDAEFYGDEMLSFKMTSETGYRLSFGLVYHIF